MFPNREILRPPSAASSARSTFARMHIMQMRFRLGGALVMFGLLVWAASVPFTHRLDEAVTTWVQRAAPAPDYPASVLVLLGNAEVVIPSVVIAAGLLISRRRDSGLATLWLAVGLTVVSLLAVALKHLIVHPGPTAQFQRPVIQVGLQANTPYSFPSGHTLRTTILTWMVIRDPRWLAGLLILSMMAALVYLGDHWLSDVLGGLGLGWVLLEARGAFRSARSRSCHRG
jgi:membrane-associated phospholipid phosphatase